jgi:hypothetical protein
MADTLDLLANVQFGAIEIDFLPGEPKQFAFAQARSADQRTGRRPLSDPSLCLRGTSAPSPVAGHQQTVARHNLRLTIAVYVVLSSRRVLGRS